MVDFVVKILLYLAPMYFANATPIFLGGRTPLDLNRKFFDGKPIFGEGKTIRGTIAGVAVGTLVGAAIAFLLPQYASYFSDYFLLSFLLALGAILGDIVASFFKRRNNIERGTEVLFLDQLDFAFGAILIGSIVYQPDIFEVFIICVTTLLVHKVSNFIAYKVKLKKVPW
jgi:CDP-2,3-bis-(O-geranylgeranyl)-sn-glycerol synthase